MRRLCCGGGLISPRNPTWIVIRKQHHSKVGAVLRPTTYLANETEGPTPVHDMCKSTSRVYILYMTSLTDLDRQLLSALREDGRASVASLARRLGVARATINSRLARLTATGTIVGFTARVRDELDPLSIHAITLVAVEGRSADKVIRQLRGFPEITALHTTNGGWDLVAELRADSLAGFDSVLGRLRAVEGILNSETSLLLSSVLR